MEFSSLEKISNIFFFEGCVENGYSRHCVP